jgi:putative hemolysin
MRFPTLIKGYLRLGEKICGEPVWDSCFNTVDIRAMLSLSEVNRR